jgi:hypothetical protein
VEGSLLETFAEELPAFRHLPLDRQSLGREAAESFVVGLRTAMAREPGPVRLNSLGELAWENEKVTFSPDRDFDMRKVRLPDFFASIGVDKATADAFLERLFPKRSDSIGGGTGDRISVDEEPYPGLFLLSQCASLFFVFSNLDGLESKEKLSKLETCICAAIHDAICRGNGIAIETIGTFGPGLKFEPDPVLYDSVSASRKAAKSAAVSHSKIQRARFNHGS